MTDLPETPTPAWGVQAVRVLIQRQDAVEVRLRQAQRWDDFATELRNWRESYLNARTFDSGSTTKALFDICHSFNLLELIGRPKAPSLSTLGGMRGRSASHPVQIEPLMRELAAVYVTAEGGR